ncbi:MAG TPA: DinB family protein [Trueperaceae bacterium]|nr:DinB family protein [Trueperaceae bacterium]
MEHPPEERGGRAPSPEAHHLVRYLQHVRRELRRALEGMSVADLERRVGNLNSVAWIVGHLAWQEQSYFLTSRGQPAVAAFVGYGRGEPDPDAAFEPLFAAWERITTAADDWLDGLDEGALRGHVQGRRLFEVENVGSLLTRVIGHYYLHIGQITAIRKLLGYPVPGFVGSQAGALYP